MNKKKLSLISNALLLVFILAVLTTVTLAWFSLNRKTRSGGMQMTIDSSPNLIISNSTTEIVKDQINSINSGSPYEITFASNDSLYKPSTHDSTYATYPAGLKYVTNPGDVDVVSGLAKTGKTLTDTGVVPNTSPSSYFVDYVVYLASYAKPLENAKLKVMITSAKKNGTEITSGSLMAATIDFYAGTTISLENYRGSLNVTEKNSGVRYLFDASNHGSTATAGTIPHNLDDSTPYLTYTLRCYFDGALTNAGSAYINTATLDTATVTLTVEFIAEE